MRFIKFDLEKEHIKNFTDLTKKIYTQEQCSWSCSQEAHGQGVPWWSKG